jgi:predicted fused transcriptional regulator/phosphomethylpyrimidine kinase
MTKVFNVRMSESMVEELRSMARVVSVQRDKNVSWVQLLREIVSEYIAKGAEHEAESCCERISDEGLAGNLWTTESGTP